MAKIRGEVDVTAKEEALLNESFLPTINAERVAQELPPFASVDEYASFLLTRAFASYVDGEKRKKKDTVAAKYADASDNVKAQIDALLG